MSRFLVPDPNPRIMLFNIPVDHKQTLDVLKSFVGSSLQLVTNKGRLWRQEDWNYIILSWNPIITLVPFSNDTKQRLCNYFSANRHIVLPSGEAATHLICGSNKPEPNNHFLAWPPQSWCRLSWHENEAKYLPQPTQRPP